MLRVSDINSKRMLIRVEQGKGGKESEASPNDRLLPEKRRSTCDVDLIGGIIEPLSRDSYRPLYCDARQMSGVDDTLSSPLRACTATSRAPYRTRTRPPVTITATDQAPRHRVGIALHLYRTVVAHAPLKRPNF
jgi:hypothetical protein